MNGRPTENEGTCHALLEAFRVHGFGRVCLYRVREEGRNEA